jgi:hypothetical protein
MEKPPSIRRPRTRLVLFAGVAIGLFCCCGGLAFFGDRPINGIRVEELEADLNERLPDGSTHEQAEQWFSSHGFEPWDIVEIGGRRIGLGATIPNDSWANHAEIEIELYFTAEGRLHTRVIYRFVYSL